MYGFALIAVLFAAKHLEMFSDLIHRRAGRQDRRMDKGRIVVLRE
jgi:hypothetical protein